MPRPRRLDLFCGAGGAAMGYHRAGFDVVGVDIAPQPRYPFAFVAQDALGVLRDLIDNQGFIAHPDDPRTYFTPDAIHASPPCPDYSRAFRHLALSKPRLIDPVRELLEATGLPWVIENVEGSPLPRQDTLDGRFGLELCGSMFGLRIQHHRLFEANVPLAAPRGCNHSDLTMNPHNKDARAKHGWNEPEWAIEKGITWTKNKHEYRDAIPPAYTELIGHQLMQHVKAKAAA